MAPAIVVNTGRDKMITYFRNSDEDTQINKLYMKEFVLLTGITEDPVVERVWDETGLGQDLSPYMIVGDVSGTPTDARFTIADRLQESGEKLRLQCEIPTAFSTEGDPIDGIAILYYTEDDEVGLMAYGVKEGSNKVAGTDRTDYVDILF